MVKRPAREKAVEARNAFFILNPPSQIMLLREDYLTISSASEVSYSKRGNCYNGRQKPALIKSRLRSQQTFVFSSFHGHSASSSF